MLRLITVLALARISVAATTPPGTGYSDADSCPPPEKAPFGAVVTHSCSFCATTLTKAPLIRKDAAWQSVAFANHATDAARLVEVDAAGRELPRGTVAPGAEKTFRCQVGTTWRARRLETNEILLEHRVGAVRLVADCVKINQCVGCTRLFFTKSCLGDDVAALVPSSGEDPASPRHRAGVASMAWRTTR